MRVGAVPGWVVAVAVPVGVLVRVVAVKVRHGIRKRISKDREGIGSGRGKG